MQKQSNLRRGSRRGRSLPRHIPNQPAPTLLTVRETIAPPPSRQPKGHLEFHAFPQPCAQCRPPRRLCRRQEILQLHPMSGSVLTAQDAVKAYTTSSGALQFPSTTLSAALIKS